MGKITSIALCVAVSALGACAQNNIRPTAALSPVIAPQSTAMAVASVTMPPSGYLDYCMRSPAECPSQERTAVQPEPLTAARWADLDRVNTLVNASVRYVTDASLYNRSEYWTYPNGRGDCEDFVLAKRKLLLDSGWRAETLLIGVALDLEGLRHAVLIASTDKGDFVLDNQLERVVAWSETGYAWEKRQTAANPNIWVALTGGAADPAPYEAPAALPVLVAEAPSPDGTAATAPLLVTNEETDVISDEGSLQLAFDLRTAPASLRVPMARPQQRQLLTAAPAREERTSAKPTAAGA